MTIKLKCPTCGDRVAIWQDGALARVRGTQRVKVRRGTRAHTISHEQNRWEWQRMWACWSVDDGATWTVALSRDPAPPAAVSAATLDMLVGQLGFECCTHRFDVRRTIDAAKRAERLDRASTSCQV